MVGDEQQPPIKPRNPNLNPNIVGVGEEGRVCEDGSEEKIRWVGVPNKVKYSFPSEDICNILFLKGLLQPRRRPKCLLLKMLKLIQT
jgi:hypothetical protein